MKISRRDALRHCFILTVSTAIIPSCLQEKSKPLLILKNLQLDGNQQVLVTELAETIIPATDTPGAKDTLTHLFVLKMMDDCSTTEQQEQFVKGMKAFNEFSEKKFDKSFVECTTSQREELLKALIADKKKEEPGDASDFYKTVKRLTLQGYMTSKHFLTNVRVYKLVPGKYAGCLPITKFHEKGGSI